MNELDLRVFQAVYQGGHGAWPPALLALTILGSGWSTLVLVPLIWATRTRRLALALAAAVLAQAVTVWFVKRVVGRVRPWIAMGLPAPLGVPHDGSFPSGHAAGSFCVAAFLAAVLPSVFPRAAWRARLLGAMALLVAALVALSRVCLAAHFPSDVCAGAVLGGFIGTAAAGLYRSSKEVDGTRQANEASEAHETRGAKKRSR
ncbi:MAG TPA: phosphatase PAP2 family protein [Polyangiaceae bacterium]|nr:phosphatase PAP2 family protein [Polyangiaceae bacterium]